MGMFTILGVIEYLKCVFILKFIFVENAVIIKRFRWVSEEDFGLLNGVGRVNHCWEFWSWAKCPWDP